MDCFGPYLRMCWGSTRVVVKETQEKVRIKKASIPLRQVFELRNILNSNVYTYFFAVRDSDGKFEKVSGGTAKFYKFRSRRTLEDGTLEPEQAVIWRSTGSVTETCGKESVLEIDTSHAHNETCAVDVSDNSQTDMLHAHNETCAVDDSDNSQTDMLHAHNETCAVDDSDNSQTDMLHTHSETVDNYGDSDSCSESDDSIATSEENLSASGSIYSMSSSESNSQFYLPIRTADGPVFLRDWVYRERAEAHRHTEIELEKTSDFVVDVAAESDDSD